MLAVPVALANKFLQAGEGLTAVRFDSSGLQCATGTSNGLVALFDLRMAKPTAVRDHMYGQPIRDIKFHQAPASAGMCAPDVMPYLHAFCMYEFACMHQLFI